MLPLVGGAIAAGLAWCLCTENGDKPAVASEIPVTTTSRLPEITEKEKEEIAALETKEEKPAETVTA